MRKNTGNFNLLSVSWKLVQSRKQ